jgi:hypothetical protein
MEAPRNLVGPALLLVALSLQSGCSSGPKTSLALWEGSSNVANYSFDQTLWRPPASGAGVQMVGYGLIPFNNGPMSSTYDPRWPPSGWITMYLRLVPQPDGNYALALLGPSSAIGPGDNEVLTGTIEHPQIDTTTKGDLRTMRIANVAIHSRNFPEKHFTISGTFTAKPGDQGEFDREVHTFDQQLSWRGPAPK